MSELFVVEILANNVSTSLASACQSRGLTIGGGDAGFPLLTFTSGSTEEIHVPTKVNPSSVRFTS